MYAFTSECALVRSEPSTWVIRPFLPSLFILLYNHQDFQAGILDSEEAIGTLHHRTVLPFSSCVHTCYSKECFFCLINICSFYIHRLSLNVALWNLPALFFSSLFFFCSGRSESESSFTILHSFSVHLICYPLKYKIFDSTEMNWTGPSLDSICSLCWRRAAGDTLNMNRFPFFCSLPFVFSYIYYLKLRLLEKTLWIYRYSRQSTFFGECLTMYHPCWPKRSRRDPQSLFFPNRWIFCSPSLL